MEISHRAKDFQPVVDEAVSLFKELLDIPEGYSVIFLGGGASLQFMQIPANFLIKNPTLLLFCMGFQNIYKIPFCSFRYFLVILLFYLLFPFSLPFSFTHCVCIVTYFFIYYNIYHLHFGMLSERHNLPEDVKSLLQKICGFFTTKMA